jgi:hypothetical protein
MALLLLGEFQFDQGWTPGDGSQRWLTSNRACMMHLDTVLSHT